MGPVNVDMSNVPFSGEAIGASSLSSPASVTYLVFCFENPMGMELSNRLISISSGMDPCFWIARNELFRVAENRFEPVLFDEELLDDPSRGS